MIAKELLSPKSIVVVGASNDIQKPGGKILWNLINGEFNGDLFAVNPKEDIVQGITCKKIVEDLPNVDLAVLAIAAPYCLETIRTLAEKKGTKGFIILSAGFI